MKFTNLLLFSFMLFFFSCSSTKIIKNLDNNSEPLKQFNYLAQHRTGNIVLKSGEVIKTEYILLEENSLKFKCKGCDSVKSISSEEINEIYFKDYLIGGFRGAIVGGLSATIISVFAAESEDAKLGVTYLYALAGGALVGSITGSFIGSKIKYKVQY